MSSHLVADLERVCDYLIVLVASQVGVAGDVDDLLTTHHRLVGPRRAPADLGAGQALVEQSHTDVQSTFVVRSTAPIDDPSWQVDRLDLEDIVLAYMSGDAGGPQRVLAGSDDLDDLAAVPDPGLGHRRLATDAPGGIGADLGGGAGPGRAERIYRLPGRYLPRRRRSLPRAAAAAVGE